MTLHAVAAMPNASVLETCFVDAPWRGDIFTENISIVDGEMLISDGPGLGVTFDAAAAAQYGAKPHVMHHHDELANRKRSRVKTH